MTSIQNPIHSEVDFAAEGKQTGYLRLPHSVHRSAYGWLPMPVASIRNGKGPKVLLMAGNHGDEYEGQVLLSRLIIDLEPAMVSGQIVILPMANYPAALAGLRTSPIDQGNMNRSFPGDPLGTPTPVIAHYIETVLLEGADLLVDLHSGGSSLLYHKANMLAADGGGPERSARLRDYLSAFGMPHAVFLKTGPGPGYYSSSAALRQGALGITTELGGAGMVQPELLALADHGLKHLLGHVGALQGDIVPDGPPGAPRFLSVDPLQHYVYASEAGLFEPLVALGAEVEAGQPAARIHFPESPGRPPVTHNFETAGMAICRRQPARCERGDCLWHLAEDV